MVKRGHYIQETDQTVGGVSHWMSSANAGHRMARQGSPLRLTKENKLHRNRLRWIGHVIQMPDHRLPKQMLYGELSEATISVGGQFKNFREAAKQTLKACDMKPGQTEAAAALDNRVWWSTSSSTEGVRKADEDRHAWLQERRDRRHQGPMRSPTQM